MAKSSGGGRKREEIPAPRTSRPIKEIAADGLRAPSTLTADEVRSLAASTMRHIEPRRRPPK
jgi:hypothetical protein